MHGSLWTNQAQRSLPKQIYKLSMENRLTIIFQFTWLEVLCITAVFRNTGCIWGGVWQYSQDPQTPTSWRWEQQGNQQQSQQALLACLKKLSHLPWAAFGMSHLAYQSGNNWWWHRCHFFPVVLSIGGPYKVGQWVGANMEKRGTTGFNYSA